MKYKLTLHIDPNERFKDHITSEKILKACGFLLPWAMNPFMLQHTTKYALTEQYGFEYQQMEGVITEDGVFQYPGNPDFHPYVKLIRDHEILYIYPHAIFAIINQGKPEGHEERVFISRMD